MTGKQTLEDVRENSVIRVGSDLMQGLHQAVLRLDNKRTVGIEGNLLNNWRYPVLSFQGSVYPALVSSLAFSADSQAIAVGHSGFDGRVENTINVWKLSTRSLVHRLASHINSASVIATRPSSALVDRSKILNRSDNYLASGTHEERDIKIWDLAQGSIALTLSGHRNGIRALAIAPSGQVLASGSYDNTVKLWCLATGALLHTLHGHQDAVSTVAFDPRGQILVTASYDKTIKLWSVATGELLKTLVGHTLKVTSIAFDPNGYHLVSGSEDCTLKLWQIPTGELQATYQGHSNSVLSVAFHPSGQLIATGSTDETVKLWSTTGQVIRTLGNPLGRLLPGHTKWVSAVSFSADGHYLASGTANGSVKVWQPRAKLSK